MSVAIHARDHLHAALQAGPADCPTLMRVTGLTGHAIRSALQRGVVEGYFRRHGPPTFLYEVCGDLPKPTADIRSEITDEEKVVLWQLAHGPMPIEEIAEEVLAVKLRYAGPFVRRLANRRGWLELVDGGFQLTDAGRLVLEEINREETSHAAE